MKQCIHTFELYAKLTLDEFLSLYDLLKSFKPSIKKWEFPLSRIKKQSTYEFRISELKTQGINYITLSRTDSILENFNISGYIKIIVNPYSALMSDMLANEEIISPTELKEAIDIIDPVLKRLLGGIYSKLKLTRIDFCINLYLPTLNAAKEYIRLLRLGAPASRLKERLHYDSTGHRSLPNIQSYTLECFTYEFEIYPKEIQMEKSNLLHPLDTDKSVVRIELRANHQKIRQLFSKYDMSCDLEHYTDILLNAPTITSIELPEFVSKMVGEGDFVSYKSIKTIILSANLPQKTKALMIDISQYLSKQRFKPDTLEHFKLSQTKWKILINKYNKLGISPIPVPERYSQNQYPGVINWITFY